MKFNIQICDYNIYSDLFWCRCFMIFITLSVGIKAQPIHTKPNQDSILYVSEGTFIYNHSESTSEDAEKSLPYKKRSAKKKNKAQQKHNKRNTNSDIKGTQSKAEFSIRYSNKNNDEFGIMKNSQIIGLLSSQLQIEKLKLFLRSELWKGIKCILSIYKSFLKSDFEFKTYKKYKRFLYRPPPKLLIYVLQKYNLC